MKLILQNRFDGMGIFIGEEKSSAVNICNYRILMNVIVKVVYKDYKTITAQERNLAVLVNP